MYSFMLTDCFSAFSNMWPDFQKLDIINGAYPTWENFGGENIGK